MFWQAEVRRTVQKIFDQVVFIRMSAAELAHTLKRTQVLRRKGILFRPAGTVEFTNQNIAHVWYDDFDAMPHFDMGALEVVSGGPKEITRTQLQAEDGTQCAAS